MAGRYNLLRYREGSGRNWGLATQPCSMLTLCYAGKMDMTTSSPVRSLYVHVPFCHTICGYCDFYSEVLDNRAVAPLVDALLQELGVQAGIRPLALQTVFVGGGTPTTLPAADLRRLLGVIGSYLSPGAEFTVESNPATVSEQIAAALVESGVNRVSIGAQSFNPGELRVLERIHRVEQVEQTVQMVRKAGIGQVNVDLIFGVPGQTLDGWLANLRTALALGVDHLSCYGLTYERGTPLHRQLHDGAVQRVDADVEADMFEATIETLAAAGFEHYEISNYARPGARCRHNLVYWRNEPCLGIGPSAASYVDGARYKNIPDAAEYARALRENRSTVIERERLDPGAAARETAMLELRLIDGIDRERFLSRFHVDPAELFASPIARHRSAGLLSLDDRRIRLTRRGLLVADSVIADFLAC